MSFTIDTGIAPQTTATQYAPDWFLDQYATAPDDRRVAHDYAYHLIGQMNNPKTMATVRKHVLMQWGFLRLLADEWPDVFDEFWAAYAERWQS